jgi:hypothetical protein
MDPLRDVERDQGPGNPIDRWFVRTLPPYSRRRLLFGLAALPVVGLVVLFARRIVGGGSGVAIYVFAALTAAGLLTLVWFGALAKRGRRPAREGRRHRPGVWSAPTASGPARRFRAADVMVGSGILFVDLTLFWIIADLHGSLPEEIAVAAPAALLGSLMWQLRGSVAGIVLLSVVVGFPVGLTLTLFGAVVGKESSLLLAWLIGSGLVLVFALPYWWDLRGRPRPSRFASIEVPAWCGGPGSRCSCCPRPGLSGSPDER